MASKVRARSLVAALFIIFTFSFACARIDLSSSHGEDEKWSLDHQVVVKGRVFCDPCLQQQFPSDTAHSLTGALVAVECSMDNNRKLRSTIVSNKAETDEYGEFRVELPSCIHTLNLNPITSCSVHLLNSAHHFCNIPSISTSSLIKPSNANGFSATYTSDPLSYRLQEIPHSLCTSSREEEEQIRISSEHHGRSLKELSTGSKASSTPPPTLPSTPSSPLPKLAVPPLLPSTIPPLPFPLPKLSVPPLTTPKFPPLNLPNAPPLNIPKLSVPPLPSLTAPPVPKLAVPPLPNTPPLPKFNIPPLNAPPLNLRNAPPLNIPKFSVPPLPSLVAPPMPKLSVPPLPNAPPLPKLNFPPLNTPNSPPLNLPNVPPFNIPKVSVPPLPSLAAPPLPKLSFPALPQFPPPSPSSFQFPPLPFLTPPPPPPSTTSKKP